MVSIGYEEWSFAGFGLARGWGDTTTTSDSQGKLDNIDRLKLVLATLPIPKAGMMRIIRSGVAT